MGREGKATPWCVRNQKTFALLQTLEETSISPDLTIYKQREIEKDKKNILHKILELEKQLF